jgi:hypothetical protein
MEVFPDPPWAIRATLRNCSAFLSMLLNPFLSNQKLSSRRGEHSASDQPEWAFFPFPGVADLFHPALGPALGPA